MITITGSGQEKTWVLHVTGRLDAQGAGDLTRAVDEALHHGWRHLELDLGAMEFISSAGLRVLQNTDSRLRPLQGTLLITAVQDFARQIIEVVGLYELLAPAVRFDPETPPKTSGDCAGMRLDIYTLDPRGRLQGGAIGSGTCAVAPAPVAPCRRINFTASTLALGVGALGRDDGDCRPRLGAFVACGGVAACRSPEADAVPDYLVYAENCLPTLFAAAGWEARGQFARLVSFEGPGQLAIGLDALASELARLGGEPAVGFVMAAEFESLAGTAGTPAPGAAAAPHEDGVALLCGFADPSGSGVHAHAAVFSYQPLRIGFLKLPDAVARLYEQPLLDVLCVAAGARLQRGVAWCAPLDSGGLRAS